MPDVMTSDITHELNYLEKAKARRVKKQDDELSRMFTLEEVEDECGGDSVEGIDLTNLEPGEYVVAYYDDEPWKFEDFVKDMIENYDEGDTLNIVVKNGVFQIV